MSTAGEPSRWLFSTKKRERDDVAQTVPAIAFAYIVSVALTKDPRGWMSCSSEISRIVVCAYARFAAPR
jgi:hypothetical protein